MKIALLGYGVVGSGVYEQLEKNKMRFNEEYDQEVEIIGVLVNTVEKYKHLSHAALFTNSYESLNSLKYDVLIETIGGIEPAFTYVSSALEQGISVITSNKDLIAEKGYILHAIAESTGARLSYEASVGGGIPILKPIRECLAGDHILEIQGIINGTTNFILTQMIQEGLSYSEALLSAQKLGFAEANPTSDVEGLDAVRKISILTKLGLKIDFDWKTLPVEGITNITFQEVEYLKHADLVIKLLGISKRFQEGVYTAVRPVILTKNSKFASVNNEFNAIKVVGESVGELYFSGKGAGKNPTATAVLGDLVDLLQNDKKHIYPNYKTSTLLLNYPEKSSWLLCLTQEEYTLMKQSEFALHPEAISSDTSTCFVKLEQLTENEVYAYKTAHGVPNAKHYLVID